MTVENWAVVLPREPGCDHRHTFSLQAALEIDHPLHILKQGEDTIDITIPFKDDADNEFLINSLRRWSINTANYGSRDGIYFSGCLLCNIPSGTQHVVMYMGTFEYIPKLTIDWTSYHAKVRFRGTRLDIDEDSTAYEIAKEILHKRRAQYEELRQILHQYMSGGNKDA